MNCVNHSDTAAVAYCRTCGKALCNACSRNVGGVVYCETCLAERMHGSASQAGAAPTGAGQTGAGQGAPGHPMGAVIPPQTRPVVAGLLGFIPGVGAMYNGQFMKGVIHVLTFVALIFLTDHFGIFGVLIGFFEFYMVFEAFKTSEAILHGLPLPDPFGLENMFGPGVNQTNWPQAGSAPNPAPGAGQQPYAQQPPQYPVQEVPTTQCGNSGIPIGAVVLIGLGCLILLDNMGWVSFSFDRFWPLILIVIGAWLFFKRWNQRVS